ncbi:MAG: DNA primase [Candidatus Altiarchaeales archaeon]|nr:DNA primase [Candidatus Altiarchaeales archaeon]
MAKAPADTVKYNIYAEITIDGVVEQPDVVGAIFGQSEGLLGEDLELRDLQKTGRIGRIEVDIKSKVGKSVGTILVPSSLDMAETAIIASAIEMVDRVGPCNARIKVLKVEDARSSKRKQMLERAKDILKRVMDEQIPESDELIEDIRKSVQLSEITSYKGLPAGPAVETAESIILVEGRADVLNLLKYGIKNAVAVGGTNIPKMIVDLSKSKTTIAFLDGDRGGDIILNELEQVTDIDYVTRAPKGKEVEDLGKKEVIMALRKKIPVKDVKIKGGEEENPTPRISSSVDEGRLLDELKSIKGKLTAKLFDQKFGFITEIEIKDLITALRDVQPTYVVFDGIITQRLIDSAARSGVSYLVGINKATDITSNRRINLLTEQDRSITPV